jgi:hypothetical protein
MNLGGGYALALYKMHKGSREEGLYAMEAIKILGNEGHPIPKELLPFLYKACDGWITGQGHVLKIHINKGYWDEKVIATHISVKCGVSLEDAYVEIAKRYSKKLGKKLSSDTVRRKYNSSDQKKNKDIVEKYYDLLKGACPLSELEDQLLHQLNIY